MSSGEEGVHRVQVSGVLPHLDDSPVADVDDDRLTILERGSAIALAARGL
jgi:hypothetical protein